MSGGAFHARGVREEPTWELDRTEARTAHRVFRAADGFEVSVPERLLKRAVAIGESNAPLEWIGQLVGTRYRDGRGRHAVVEAVVQDLAAKREPHFVTSTHDSEGRTKALAREQFPDAVVLGWIHGHVRHGVRYSRRDFENQATWTDPDSIGIVVDPWNPDLLAVYRGPAGELLTLVARDVAAENALATPQVVATGGNDARTPRTTRTHTRGCRRRLHSALIEIAAFVVGLWMGWTDARVRAFERRRASATTSATTAAQGRGFIADPTPREPAVCEQGHHASEHVEGAAALQCRASEGAQREDARNTTPLARMRKSDTPRRATDAPGAVSEVSP